MTGPFDFLDNAIDVGEPEAPVATDFDFLNNAIDVEEGESGASSAGTGVDVARDTKVDRGAPPPRPDLSSPSWKHDRTEPKLINGKWYMRSKRSGAIMSMDESDPNWGIPTDDPDILVAFGKTGMTKEAKKIRDKSDIAGDPGGMADLEAGWYSLRKGLEATKFSGAQQALDEQPGSAEITGGFAGLKIPRHVMERARDEGLTGLAEFAGKEKAVPTAPSVDRFNKSKTWGDAWTAFADDPITVTRSTVLRSAPSSMPSVVGGIVGSVLGPAGAAGGAGAGSYITELGDAIGNGLAERGADLNDAASVMQTWKQFGPEIMQKANVRAAVIGAFDAATGGIGAKLVAKPAESLIGEAGKILAGTGVQAVGGAGGEAGAEVATGEPLNPAAILGEAIGEVGSGAAETTGQAVVGAVKSAAGTKGDRQPPQPGVPPQQTSPPMQPAPRPNAATKQNKAPTSGPEAAELLASAGYTLDDVRAMSTEQYQQTIEELVAQGATVQPGATLQPETPPPGAAPMAPRPKPEPPIASLPSGDKSTEPPIAVDPLDFLNEAEDVGDGTRTKPVKVADQGDIEAARAQVEPEPTEAQAAAGNFKHGHLNWQGLDIAIETPKGGVRRGRDSQGREWSVPNMPADYGRIKRTIGNDDEQMDVYIGPDLASKRVFVIDQIDLKTGRLDEAKIIVASPDQETAQAIYDGSFSDASGPSRRKNITETTVDGLKDWLDNGDATRPFARQGKFHGAEALATSQKQPASAQEPEPAPTTAAHPRIGYTKSPDEDFDAIFDQAVDEQFAEPTARAESSLHGKPASYVIVRKSDGKAMMETFDAEVAAKVNTEKYEAVPILTHLQNLNNKLEADAAVRESVPPKGKKKQAVKPAVPAVEEKLIKPRKSAQAGKALTLTQFIAKNGGIRDERGELASRDLHKKFIPGFGPLVRKRGKSHDEVLRAAIQEGYILDPSRIEGTETQLTTQVLYDALDAENAGKPVYANEADTHTAQVKADAKKADIDANELDRYSADEQGFIGKHGFETFENLHLAISRLGMEWRDWKPTDIDRAGALMNEGMDAEGALERAAAEDDAQPAADVELANQEEADIVPFDHDVHPRTTPEGGEGLRPGRKEGDRSSAEEAVGGEGASQEAVRKAGEPASDERGSGEENLREEIRPPEAEEVAPAEKTAAGEQTVVPGAERISDREQAQRKSDEKLKPKTEQKPMESGLFGDEKNQTDIFDAQPAGLSQGNPENLGTADFPFYEANQFHHEGTKSLGEAARDYVVSNGIRTGNEWMLTLRADGSVLVDGHGSSDAIGWAPAFRSAIEDPGQSLIIHHNHPKNSPLSTEDLINLAAPGIEVIWAHGHKGAGYRATLPAPVRDAAREMGPQRAIRAMKLAVERTFDLVGQRLWPEIDAGRISQQAAQDAWYHLAARALHQAGLIDYTAVSPPEVADAVVLAATSDAAILGKRLRKEFFNVDASVLFNRNAPALHRHSGDVGRALGLREKSRAEPDTKTVVDPASQLGDRAIEGTRRLPAATREEDRRSRLKLPGFDEGRFQPSISREKRAEIVRTVQAVANQVFGRSLRLGVVDELESGSQGRFDPNINAVIVALRASLSPIETLGHEAIHGLRNIGAITKPEWAAISRWARESVLPNFTEAQRYREHYGSKYRLTPEQLEEIVLEEAVAEYFGRVLSQDPTLHREMSAAIGQIFMRLREFLIRLRNYLNGAGFRTAEDILAGIARGEKANAPVKESAREFDLESLDDTNFAARFMQELAANDELFQNPISQKRNLSAVLKEIAPEIEYAGLVSLPEDERKAGIRAKILLRTGKGKDFYVYEGEDNRIWMDVSQLAEGERGSAIYAAVANYAYNRGKVFTGDPEGLSDIALRRRTDAMLSSALKFGTTRHLEPHPRQVSGDPALGVPPLRWTEGDDLGNVQALIDVSTASLNNAIPELKDARYDFETRTFRDAQGELLSDEKLQAWRNYARRAGAPGIGHSTLRRGILLDTLSRAPGSERPGILQQALSIGHKLVAQGGLRGSFYSLSPGKKGAFESLGGRMPPSGPNAVPPTDAPLDYWRDRSMPLLSRVGTTTEMAYWRGRYYLQDRFKVVDRIQKAIAEGRNEPLPEMLDVYTRESLYYGRAGEKLERIRNLFAEPLVDGLADRGLLLDELDRFLYASHAIERNKVVGMRNPPGSQFREAISDPSIVGASGMSANEARGILDGFRQEGKAGGLREMAGIVYQLNRETRKTLLDFGLINRETFDNWSETFARYIPLQGWENDPDGPEAMEQDAGNRTGQRFDIRGKEAQTALGRSSKADSPVAAALAQASRAVIRAEKNRVGAAFLRLVMNNPNPRLWEMEKIPTKRVLDQQTGLVREVHDPNYQRKDNVFATKVNGETYFITIHHADLARAMKGLGTDNMNVLIRAMAMLNRYYAMINTQLNPEFIISNFLRDLQTAGINLQGTEVRDLTGRILADVRKAVAGVNQGLKGNFDSEWARHYQEYADAGAKTAFFGLDDIEGQKRKLEALMKAHAQTPWQVSKSVLLGGLEVIQRWNAAVENGVRLSTYVHARRVGLSKDKAASLARELTVNFNRRGEGGALMNALYLFFNARLQGSVRMLQALRYSSRVRKLALSVIVGALLLDMLNRWIAPDDDDGEDEYDKIPDWEKERNLIVMAPSWWPEALRPEGGYFKWNMPYGYNILSTIGTNAGAVISGAKDPMEAAANVAASIGNAFNPIDQGSSFLSFVSPTAIDPIVDIYLNRDYLGRRIMPEPREESTPDSQKAWPSSWWGWREFASVMNRASGGNEVRPGMVDISPETIEHLFGFATGGLGKMAERSGNLVSKLASGDEIETDQIPFIRKVLGGKARYVDRDRYYDIVDSVELTKREFKLRIEQGDRDEAKRVREGYPVEFAMINMVETAEKDLRRLRASKKKILAGTKNWNERSEREKSLDTRIDEIMLRVRQRYNSLKEAQ